MWAGAGGYVREDCVAPVFVALQNDETDRDGVVVVRFRSLGLTTSEARLSVPLPPNSRKGVFLYVPNMGRSADVVEVSYETARGRTVHSTEEPLRTVGGNLPVIASVGSMPDGLPPHETSDGDALYTPLFVDLERLPDDAIGLEMFDALVFSPPPDRPLRREQVEALHEWVIRGGTLVVDASSRTDAFLQGTFASMLPFVPESITSGRIGIFGTTVTYTRGRVENADVLLASASDPLVIRRNYGLGSITVFAVSPASPAFSDWPERSDIWNDILHGVRIEPGQQRPDAMANLEEQNKTALMNLVRTEQRTGLRLGLVLVLTALYALVVGPGDYFFIKWLGKPKMTWVTFPTIVAVFTVAAWVGAKVWVGGDMASSHIRRTMVFPELNTASRYDLMALFVPEGREYAVNTVDHAPIQTIQPVMAADPYAIADLDTQTSYQRIPIWKTRVYGSSLANGETPSIDLLIERRDGVLKAVVSNQSDLTLRQNAIMFGSSVFAIDGDIAPGAKHEVDLVATTRFGRGQWAGRGGILSGVFYTQNEHWPHGREFDLRDALRRGAYAFVSNDAGEVANPLEVDGVARPEKGRHIIQVVTYPAGIEVAAPAANGEAN